MQLIGAGLPRTATTTQIHEHSERCRPLLLSGAAAEADSQPAASVRVPELNLGQLQ